MSEPTTEMTGGNGRSCDGEIIDQKELSGPGAPHTVIQTVPDAAAGSLVRSCDRGSGKLAAYVKPVTCYSSAFPFSSESRCTDTLGFFTRCHGFCIVSEFVEHRGLQ